MTQPARAHARRRARCHSVSHGLDMVGDAEGAVAIIQRGDYHATSTHNATQRTVEESALLALTVLLGNSVEQTLRFPRALERQPRLARGSLCWKQSDLLGSPPPRT